MSDLTFTGLTVSVVRLDDEGRYSFGVPIDGAFVEFHSRPAGGVDAAIAEAKAAAEPPAPEPPAEPATPPAPPAQQLSDEGAAAEQAEPAPNDEQVEPKPEAAPEPGTEPE